MMVFKKLRNSFFFRKGIKFKKSAAGRERRREGDKQMKGQQLIKREKEEYNILREGERDVNYIYIYNYIIWTEIFFSSLLSCIKQGLLYRSKGQRKGLKSKKTLERNKS